jgi:hypothetical protein
VRFEYYDRSTNQTVPKSDSTIDKTHFCQQLNLRVGFDEKIDYPDPAQAYQDEKATTNPTRMNTFARHEGKVRPMFPQLLRTKQDAKVSRIC